MEQLGFSIYPWSNTCGLPLHWHCLNSLSSGLSKTAAQKLQAKFVNCKDKPIDLGYPGDAALFDYVILPYLHILLEVKKCRKKCKPKRKICFGLFYLKMSKTDLPFRFAFLNTVGKLEFSMIGLRQHLDCLSCCLWSLSYLKVTRSFWLCLIHSR